jgi:para-aminobenzoate synthetase component 1
VLAVDAFTSLKTDFYNAFEDVAQYQQTTKDWLFIYLMILKMIWNRYTLTILTDLIFLIYFFQPKSSFFDWIMRLKFNIWDFVMMN